MEEEKKQTENANASDSEAKKDNPAENGEKTDAAGTEGQKDTQKTRKEIRAEKKAQKKLDKEMKKAELKAISLWQEFKKFVAKGNVIDLAVAVIVGAAFNKVVNTLVANIITPLTSLLIPSGTDYTQLQWVLREEVLDKEGKVLVAGISVTYGVFIEAVVNFLIISFTLFFVIRSFLKIKELLHKKEIEEAKKKAEAVEKKKKEAADAEAARLEKIKQDFIEDVAIQADELREIKQIMLRMEQNSKK